MKKLPLDMSKFKKIKSDAKSSTLRHEDGHTLTIAHQALSPSMLGALNKLPALQENSVDEKSPMEDSHHGTLFAEGGQAEPNPQPNGMIPDDSSTVPDQPGQPAMASNDAAPQEATRSPAFSGDYGLEKGIQNQITGLQEQGQGQQQAEIEKGKVLSKQAPVEQNAADVLRQGALDYKKNLDDLMASSNSLQNEIATGKVNPRQFIDNMSTGDKISTGIGLVIGGMGAGLTHSPNLAFQYLQSQIDRDIESQKANLGKNQNLLSLNLQQQGNLGHAMEAQRIQMQDIVAHELIQKADESGNPIAAANAQSIAGMFLQKKGEMQQNLSIQKAMLGSGGSPDDQMKKRIQFLYANGKSDFAKQLEEKYLPGSGTASVPITPENRKQLDTFNKLDQTYQEAQDYLNKSRVIGAGFQNANKAKGQAIMTNIELTMGELQDLGRFTPEEAKRYKALIPDLTGTHFTDQDQARLDELKIALANHKNSVLQGKGLPTSPAQTSDQIQIRNGVKYKHVTGGWKKVK